MLLPLLAKRGAALSICLACVLTGCTSMPPESPVQAMRARQLTEELTLGRELAARLLGRLGSLDDPRALRYVNLVGQSIALQSGRPELAFHFAILATPQIGAYSTPGGYIFITRGMLGQLKSESELALVLAHEIAHVNERHMYERLVKGHSVSTQESLARFLARGAGTLGAMSQMVTEGMRLLLEEGLGKEKELAADEAGMFYASDAGYNPASLVELLERLAREEHQLPLEKTHPAFPERIETARRTLTRNGFGEELTADSGALDLRFQESLGPLKGNGHG